MDVRTYMAFREELEKIALAAAPQATTAAPPQKRGMNWHKFREGLMDEGIPLAGATVGAGLGGLRGAALGYAAGGLASIARSKMKGEDPSLSRKLLAGSALGYGLGGLAHWGLEHFTKGMAEARPSGMAAKMFHAPGKGTFLSRATEEALPAAGATLATGIAMGTHKEKRAPAPMVPGKGKHASAGVNTFVNETFKGGAHKAFEAARKAKIQALMSRPVSAGLKKLSSTNLADGALSLFAKRASIDVQDFGSGHMAMKSLSKAEILARHRARPLGMAGMAGAANKSNLVSKAMHGAGTMVRSIR